MIFQIYGAPQLSALYVVTFMTQVLKTSVMHVNREAYASGFHIIKPATASLVPLPVRLVVASSLRDLNVVLPDLKEDADNHYLVFVTDAKEACADHGLPIYPLGALGVEEIAAITAQFAQMNADVPDRLTKVADSTSVIRDNASASKTFVQTVYPFLYRFSDKAQRSQVQQDFVYTLAGRKSWALTGLKKLDELMTSSECRTLAKACQTAIRLGLAHSLANLKGAEESDVRYVVNRYQKLESTSGRESARPNRRSSSTNAANLAPETDLEDPRLRVKPKRLKVKRQAILTTKSPRSLFS